MYVHFNQYICSPILMCLVCHFIQNIAYNHFPFECLRVVKLDGDRVQAFERSIRYVLSTCILTFLPFIWGLLNCCIVCRSSTVLNNMVYMVNGFEIDTCYLNMKRQIPYSNNLQLEMLKGDGALEQSEVSSPPEMIASATEKIENKNVKVGEVDERCLGNDDIVKELKKLNRQNFVTHCLLSVMIVLTVVWQLSEVSLVLKVKDGLSHPFRALGNTIAGMFKVRDKNGQAADNKEHQPEPPAHPSLQMPHVDFPNLGSNNEE